MAYYRRALPRFVEVKRLLDAGRLGRLLRVDVRYESDAQARLDRSKLPWRVQAQHAGGGLFLDLASHTLDVLDFLLGPLQFVGAEARNVCGTSDVEDRVELAFDTSAGVVGHGSWNFSGSGRADSIRFEGSDGALTLSTFGDGPLELESATGTESFSLPNPTHIQQPLIQSVVDQLHGRGSCPSTGSSAARTSALMDRALLGYYGSRGAEFWSDPLSFPGLGASNR
ncbi:MAG: Gfo/Idh/MocA family oxidoreductase [Polyangiaceae bacterium]